MAYYIFIENGKINGAGQARILKDTVTNFEVTEEKYNEFIANPDKFIWDGKDVIENPDYEQEQAEKRKEEFNKEFFKTSLGYIRRKVSMATGETKDFLFDLLPAIEKSVSLGRPYPVIVYKQPDFTKEITMEYLVSLQEFKNATEQFCKECTLQIGTDFSGVPMTLNDL